MNKVISKMIVDDMIQSYEEEVCLTLDTDKDLIENLMNIDFDKIDFSMMKQEMEDIENE